MTEKEIKEYVTEIRHKADIFRKSGFATAGFATHFDKSADIIEELLSYKAIGTIEEFKALKEKNKLIKPRFVMNKRSDTVSIWECRCGNLFRTKNKEGVLDGIDVNYCSKCGVKLDWQ